MDSHQILDVWAAGRADPVARPLLMLAAVCPDRSSSSLAELPVGQCNELLLRDRQVTFGDQLDGDVTCPGCGERLEVAVRLAELLTPRDGWEPGGDSVRAGEVEVRFRSPGHADLMAASASGDAAAAARVLLSRCVLSASRGGVPVPVADLPDEALAALDTALARRDPHADLRLAATCASCAHTFELAIDPAGLYWAELAEHARRLLVDVHRLASAYGWSEQEILRLDPARRDAYLELVG